MSIERDRITSIHASSHDLSLERSLRPTQLGQFVGQAKVKEQIGIAIEAAQHRDESLDHTLICGPPGLGKTTLAHIIANELGVAIKATSGPVIEIPGRLAAMITTLEPGDVLFVDEIHRLSPVVEERLYPAMEDAEIDIPVGEGPAAKSIKFRLPQFTLVGATTRAGLLTSPFRDRFGIVQRLEFYSVDELAAIIEASAAKMDISVDRGGAREIAGRSRGTPRIANRLARRVRDYVQVRGDGRITKQSARKWLDRLDVDQEGFDQLDRKLLNTMVRHFGGGPVGLDSLAVAISEEKDTIEDVLEPYLIREGFLMRTPRGRVATEKTYRHLGLKPAANARQSPLELFEAGEDGPGTGTGQAAAETALAQRRKAQRQK